MRERARSLVLVALLVCAAVAGVGVVSADSKPSGMVGVPDGNVSEEVPSGTSLPVSASDFEHRVLASRHASTLSLTMTTAGHADDVMGSDSVSLSGDEMALVLADDTNHEGREVAIEATVLRQALGYIPQTIEGTHDDGTQWTRSVEYENGYVVFEVPSFSANAITFGGTVSIDGQFGAGSSTRYELSDPDAVSDFTASVMGVRQAERDHETATLGDSGSMPLSMAGDSIRNGEVALTGVETTSSASTSASGVSTGSTSWTLDGNQQPEDPTVTFTGVETSSSGSLSSTSLSSPGSVSVGVGGNQPPSDGQVTLTASASDRVIGDSDSGSAYALGDVNGYHNEMQTQTKASGTFDSVDIYLASLSGTPSNINADVYVSDNGKIGGSLDRGTLVASDWSPSGTGWQTINFGQSVTLDGSDTLALVDTGSAEDGSFRAGLRTTSDGGSDSYRWIHRDTSGDFREDDVAKLRWDYVDDVSVSTDAGSTSFGGLSDGESKTKSVPLSSSTSALSVDWSGSGSMDVSASWTEHSATEDPSVGVGGSTTRYNGVLTQGETETKSLTGLSAGGNTLDWGIGSGPSFDATVSATEVYWTANPSVDVDGDGVGDVSYAGTLADGETVTKSVSELSRSSTSADVSTAGGSTVAINVSYTEVVDTPGGSVEVNGNSTSFRALNDGESSNLSTDSAWVRNGTNRVNVSLDTGSLSTDAPAPVVGLNYSHAAASDQTVQYSAEEWSERYNVSKEYASERSSASVTIPFEGRVIGARDVRMRTNGGAWTDVPAESRSWSNTTMTVDLGSVAAGDSVTVVANGTKVQVSGGSIQVTEPTPLGDSLNSKIAVTSADANADLALSVGGTSSRMHYTYNESWTDASEYALVGASGGQSLVVPGAETAETFRVSTIPVEASPKSGDVAIEVREPRQSEPVFSVSSGNTPSDTVSYTFLNAQHDTDYVLYSQTHGIVRDSGTANSPVTLVDDDSSETLAFQVDDGGNNSSGSDSDSDGGSGYRVIGQFSDSSSSSGGGVNWLGLGVLIFGGVGLLYVGGRYSGSSGTSSSRVGRVLGSVGRGSKLVAKNPKVVGALGALALVAAVVTGVIPLPDGAGVLLLVTALPVVTYVVLRKTGNFDYLVFGVVSAAAVLLGLQLTGGVVTSLITSPQLQKFLPFVAIGVVYVAYRGVKAYRAGNTTNVVVETESDGK